MQTITITQARKNLFTLANQVIEQAKEVVVSTKKGSFVMISEENWSAIQETLYLLKDKQLMSDVKKYHNCQVEDFEEVAWDDIA